MDRTTVFVGGLLLVGCPADEGPGDPASSLTSAETEMPASSGMQSQDPSSDPTSDPTNSTQPPENTTDTGDPPPTSSSATDTGDPPPSACDKLVGEGFAVGQVAEDWTLQDGSGAAVNLHDYCGDVIFIEIGSEW